MQHVEGIADPYWQGQAHPVLPRYRSEVTGSRRDYAKAQIRVTEHLMKFYELTAPVSPIRCNWYNAREGMFMQPHADRANPDGAKHIAPHRDFGSVIYLNDDYEGGELYFTSLDMVVKPKAGTLAAFTGNWYHEHGVIKVDKGLRITMPAFYTFDESKKDLTIYK